jgi:23S rRNA (adenine2503-C2)-methyltransferase
MQEKLEKSQKELPSPYFLTLEDWKSYLVAAGEKPFRAKQIYDWIFQKRVSSHEQMLNLSKDLRMSLSNDFDWSLPKIISRLDSKDGASKLLLEMHDGKTTEAVILRYKDRVSLCVSSQVGCKLACKFCQTGKLGFFRHLTAREILAQFLIANSIVDKEEGRRVSHIVFMGMGEPFDNYEQVAKAVKLFVGADAYDLSKRRVTISTSGIVPKIERMAEELDASLAVSLHACNDELRTELMPINRKYSLAKLKDALRYYQQKTGQKITIEYILIADQNCEPKHAKELVQFLEGLKAKVNLIPFNAHPGLPYTRPQEENIETFQGYLAKRSIPAPVRYSKGLEVSAACGQLASKSLSQLHKSPQRRNVIEQILLN